MDDQAQAGGACNFVMEVGHSLGKCLTDKWFRNRELSGSSVVGNTAVIADVHSRVLFDNGVVGLGPKVDWLVLGNEERKPPLIQGFKRSECCPQGGYAKRKHGAAAGKFERTCCRIVTLAHCATHNLASIADSLLS